MATFRTKYAQPKYGTDTVVFIHGLIGDIVGTWGRFPELLRTDPDLPKLDVLMCGYHSRVVRWDPDVSEAGERLIAELELQVQQGKKIFLVGHSMGGLVIFSALTNAMADGHAQSRPCSDVAWITLFASPVNGSQAAAVLRAIWWGLRYLTFLPIGLVAAVFGTRQIKNLARGTFVDKLVSEIANRVYEPKIQPGDINSKREISIRAVVGAEDLIVTKSSAEAIFQRPAPLRVTGTHGTVKEPENHHDSRYLALSKDVASCFADSFVELCTRCAAGDELSQGMFWDQWEHAITTRVRETFPDSPDAEELRETLAALTWEVAPQSGSVPPREMFQKALVYLKGVRRGKNS
jgi:pimeloyl-ACP methyl ester carboxylesterase